MGNFEQYETILLGYPNWWGDMPMPVYSFLEEYDFGAKMIIPFVTHGGSGASQTIETISEIQPGALMRDNALILSRDEVSASGEAVTEWASQLGINAKNSQETMEQNEMTVASTAVPTPTQQQRIYLWDEGNMPAITEYTENTGFYADDPDFRPYMTFYPVPEGTEIKGAVLVNSGGAFAYRSNENEGGPTAEDLSRLGYQSFLVDYRVSPYTQEEGALDLARAVRFVRAHAIEYGIDEKDIAVMGFSAGGILSGEELLNYDGMVNGRTLDKRYVPDALDDVSADAAAAGMIYSFYGRLSAATDDVEKLAVSDLPPTFFAMAQEIPLFQSLKKI
ncbi:flavodoxin [Enterocloster sp.]|uniref:flavodoxin n=1 Tax=Enterocloster sp. TaxID=2719315 RepID=UPI003993D2DF